MIIYITNYKNNLIKLKLKNLKPKYNDYNDYNKKLKYKNESKTLLYILVN